MPKSSEKRPPRRTRGGHAPTGTSAKRRAKASSGASAKGERTRATIIAAARRVFERDGYFDARVSDIVSEAGVSHGSYYTYFSTKKDVFEAVSDAVGKDIDVAVGHSQSDTSRDPLTNLRNANARYLEVQRANSVILNLIDQVSTVDAEIHAQRIAARRRHVDRVAGVLVRMQQRDLVRIDSDVYTTAGALVAMLASVAYWSSACPDDYVSVDEVVTNIWARAIGLKTTASSVGTTPPTKPAVKPAANARPTRRSKQIAS